MKNRLSAIFVVIVCFCTVPSMSSQDLRLLERLPPLGRDWSPGQRETRRARNYEYSWATFTNSKTGDKLSFAADRYTNGTNGIVRSIASSPVRQAAVDMFPGGLPRFLPHPNDGITGWGVADVIRFNVVTLETGVQDGLKNLKAEALEYTCIYDNEAKFIPNRLAQGYAMSFGDTVVFIQHTSSHPITSEDAKGMALFLIRSHQ